MTVPEEMRRIEDQIDRSIGILPIWKHSRSVLLRRILLHYRNAIEVLMLMAGRGELEGKAEDVRYALMSEQRLRFGILQALKWGMEFASEGKKGKAPSWRKIFQLAELASDYEVVVDYLKSAKYDEVTMAVDKDERIITIFEGGDLTGSDSQLIFSQYERLPIYSHIELTHESDQLTARWNAGQFRSVVDYLKDIAVQASETVYISLHGKKLPFFLRPVLVEIPDLSDPPCQAVLEDLTLTDEKVLADKWRLVSLVETPLVLIGRRRFSVSDILIALARVGYYDNMLRLASRVDPNQYTTVSGLREQRMMDICRQELTMKGWTVETGTQISAPVKREIDVLAYRGDTSMLIQLKSTLRPETPWEVFKRNEDIVCGIKHTSEVASMLPRKPVQFVITDGYRGDFRTWALALKKGIPIGTLRDLADIAEDPMGSVDLLKERVGFDSTCPAQPIPDRCFEIMGWTFRVVDAPAPS